MVCKRGLKELGQFNLKEGVEMLIAVLWHRKVLQRAEEKCLCLSLVGGTRTLQAGDAVGL